MNEDGMTKKEEQNGYYRIRDGKRRVLQKIIVGAAFLGCGMALAIHAYWHSLDPFMLGVSAALALLGMYLTWDASNELDEQIHSLGRGLFGMKAA